MKRSHRLLRQVHRLRVERLDLAANPHAYAAYDECASLDRLMRAAEGDGFFTPAATFDATMAVVEGAYEVVRPALAPGGVAGRVAQAVLAAALANRADADGRVRLGGTDRQLAEGCAALAHAAVLDRVHRAVAEVMRRRALVDHRPAPCWPADYVRRRAEASEVEALVAGVEGGSPSPSPSTGLPSGLGGSSGEDGARASAGVDDGDLRGEFGESVMV